jgi:hypothetical protein
MGVFEDRVVRNAARAAPCDPRGFSPFAIEQIRKSGVHHGSQKSPGIVRFKSERDRFSKNESAT